MVYAPCIDNDVKTKEGICPLENDKGITVDYYIEDVLDSQLEDYEDDDVETDFIAG